MPSKRRPSRGSRGASAGERHVLKRPAAAAAVGALSHAAPARAPPALADGNQGVVRIWFNKARITVSKGAEIEAKAALGKAYAEPKIY